MVDLATGGEGALAGLFLKGLGHKNLVNPPWNQGKSGKFQDSSSVKMTSLGAGSLSWLESDNLA